MSGSVLRPTTNKIDMVATLIQSNGFNIGY